MDIRAKRSLHQAYHSHREVFDKHFASLQRAEQTIEDADRGDDRAAVSLWKFYADAKHDFSYIREPSTQYSLRTVTIRTANVVNLSEAQLYRDLARQASNLESIDFHESVELGNRDPVARYGLYNHGANDYIDKNNPAKRAQFAGNPHLRYKGELWWDISSVGTSMNSRYICEGFAGKDVSESEYFEFWKRVYGVAGSALEQCALSGSVVAASELVAIFEKSMLSYELDKWFFTKRSVPNPLYDKVRAEYWARVRGFLDGSGSDDMYKELFLQKVRVLSEYTSPGNDCYNLGVALATNKTVLAAYLRRHPGSEINPAETLIQEAVKQGSASAAWYKANALYTDYLNTANISSREEGLDWCKEAARLKHPSAQHLLSLPEFASATSEGTAVEPRTTPPGVFSTETPRRYGIMGSGSIKVSPRRRGKREDRVVAHGFKEGYALIVGIAGYQIINPLPAVVLDDARDLSDLLRSPIHAGYLEQNVRLLLDRQATAAALRDGLDWLATSAGSGKTALFFFSGHGGHLPDAEEATHWLLPWDADPGRLPSTALSGQELSERLRAVAAERLVALFDCCFAAGTAEAKRNLGALRGFKSGLQERYFERLAEGRGRVILASSREDEISLVLPGMKNSLFTHFLLEGLRGAARTRGDGLIRVLDLFDYLSEKVPSRDSQHPVLKTATETNFPLALWRGGNKETSSALRNSTAPADKRALREAMVRVFTTEDLQLLCADIEADLAAEGIDRKVDLEMFGGQGRPAKVLHLIEYLDNLQLLPVLVHAVQRHRPGLL